MSQLISIMTDSPEYDQVCEALYARNFGPGRFAKAAGRLREGNECRRDLSVLAFSGNGLVGACRLWPITASNGVNALFLGPIAVDPVARHSGLGQRLVEACLARVDSSAFQHVILVGDLSFFGKMAFEIVPDGYAIMPGPVDPKRLLWRKSPASETLPQGRLSVPRATSPKG